MAGARARTRRSASVAHAGRVACLRCAGGTDARSRRAVCRAACERQRRRVHRACARLVREAGACIAGALCGVDAGARSDGGRRKRIRCLDTCRRCAHGSRIRAPEGARRLSRCRAACGAVASHGGARGDVVAGAMARTDRGFRCAAPSGAARDAHRFHRGSRGRAGSAGHPRGRARNATPRRWKTGRTCCATRWRWSGASMQAPSPSRRFGAGALEGMSSKGPSRGDAIATALRDARLAALRQWKRRQMR